MVYPQVDIKKARVTLNGFGIIDGSGFDTHCIRLVAVLLRHFFDTDASDAQLKSWSLHISGKMSYEAAINFNDNIGELSQQYQKGGVGRDWAIKVFQLIAEKNSYFIDIFDKFSWEIMNKKY